MNTKKILVGLSIGALVYAAILISLKAYYVLVAVIAGTLVMLHRELWSLVRTGKMPPVDGRVKENTAKSIRNGFTFFAAASILLMLLFSVNRTRDPGVLHILSTLFVSTGVVYVLSYLFYDRAEPNLNERGLKMLRTFLVVAGISVAAFILSAFLHNVVSGAFAVEEPVFFFIATILAPLSLAVGFFGALVIFIRGLVSSRSA